MSSKVAGLHRPVLLSAVLFPRNSMLAPGAACLAMVFAGCLAPEDPSKDADNTAPFASLRAPVIAPADKPVPLDAGESFDEEGGPLLYVFELGDGSHPLESSDALVTPTFQSAGLYTVLLRVIDSAGLEGHAEQDITVRLEYPEPPDFCEVSEDCVVGDLCEAGVCYSLGGTLD